MLPLHIVLSQLEVPYSDCPTQADLTRRYADALAVINAKENGTYRSLPTVQFPAAWPAVDPNQGDTSAESIAVADYYGCLLTGDLTLIHERVDAINQLRAKLGWPIFLPPADIDILANSLSSAGLLARRCLDRQAAGEHVILLDPPRAQLILDAAHNSTPIAPPVVTPTLPPVNSTKPAPIGDTVPAGMVITDEHGLLWKRQQSVSPFGTANYYVRVA